MTLDTTTTTTRVDMHCHSTASQVSKLGVQRALGLPECATPPQEVYELAKRRGMDFVTITDHDTIDGVLQIADRPDVFVSEELTAHFRGEPQAVHVLCYGITPEDHEWLQAHRGDVEMCAAYLYEREIACALAHPYYTVGAPLTARHRRRLAELFGVWEIRNGARARELNRPAATYVATRDGIGIGGSDDHAGVDIGRTYTDAPAAATPAEFLAHLRAGRVSARGEQGSAAKWAHAAIALAARSLGPGGEGRRREPRAPTRAAVLTMVQRLLREGDARQGATGADLSPADARCLLRAWLSAVELDHLDERGLIAYMQDERFQPLRPLPARLPPARAQAARRGRASRCARPPARPRCCAAAEGLFESCIAAIPYAPATAFLANEQAKLDGRAGDDGETPRVAILADGIGSMHGVTRTIEEIRQRGVPGFEIEVVGTDPEVDRRLSAVAEIDVPYYPGLSDRRAQPARRRADARRRRLRRDPRLLARPRRGRGRARRPRAGAAACRQLPHRADRLRRPALRASGAWPTRWRSASSAFYSACDVVLSPSPASDAALAEIGMAAEKVAALGPRRGHLPLRPGAARATRLLPGRPSTSSTPGASPARRAPTCSPTRSCSRARATPGCTSCSPAAAPSRSACASASATPRRSSAGSRAPSSRAPTRAPTCSCSRAAPTPSAR